jgi:hypothetical protein
MTELSDVLEQLIAPFSTEERPLTTVRAQAEFLGVSAPQLSRLRQGNVPLTRRMAGLFAIQLGATPTARDDVLQELLKFTESAVDRGAVARSALSIQVRDATLNLESMF